LHAAIQSRVQFNALYRLTGLAQGYTASCKAKASSIPKKICVARVTMAKKFDFAFVQQKNLGLQFFAVTQAYVTFTVTGNDDPTTLQEMRDEVSDEFHKYQKRINEFIKNRNVEISKLSRKNAKSDAPKLVSGGHTTIQNFFG